MTKPGGVVRIATLNVRNTADGWRRRRELLLRQLLELDPDIIGLQELRSIPDQAAWIDRAVKRRTGGQAAYQRYRTYKTGLWGFWEGIGVLSRLPVVERASLGLGGQYRVAQRVKVRLPDGGLLEVYNAHLASKGESVRTAQAERILEWMEGSTPSAPKVLLGDLNARPGSTTVDLLAGRLRSAHVAVHGCEPEKTVPTSLRRGASGPGSVLDFVFVSDDLEVHDAQLAFDQVDPADEHLVASDHYGLVASVSLRVSPPAS